MKDAVRRLAFSTSVDQLKKRGVKNVNVVGLDRIVQLIEEAVHRSLKNRLLVGDRMAVADATKEEFLRLLRTNEELQQHKARAEEEAESLRLELTRLRQDLAAKLAMAEASQQADYVKQDEAIRDLIGAALQEAGGGGEGLEARVLELVMHVVQSERRVSEAAQEAARDRDVSLLQRRIEKLSASLESTEKQLREVSSRKDVEAGIASVYREVQGLSDADNQFGKKKELMAGIFAANLQLQKKS
ncbi:MAG: hypothetical protein O3B85_03995 [Planctomycetota bacterium]|nr:hypothetical protein [Planctomycetota bacterium]